MARVAQHVACRGMVWHEQQQCSAANHGHVIHHFIVNGKVGARNAPLLLLMSHLPGAVIALHGSVDLQGERFTQF
jgi:hypothetical protein